LLRDLSRIRTKNPEKPESNSAKNKRYADMGLSRIFEYLDEKGRVDTYRSFSCLYYLLHTLVPVFHKSKLGFENISHSGLELVRDDGSCHHLVFDKFTMDRPKCRVGGKCR